MDKEGRRIAAAAFIRLKWSTAIVQTSRMVYVYLFCVYMASDEGLRSLKHASLTKSCQSLCLQDFTSRICMTRVHVPLHIYSFKHNGYSNIKPPYQHFPSCNSLSAGPSNVNQMFSYEGEQMTLKYKNK